MGKRNEKTFAVLPSFQDANVKDFQQKFEQSKENATDSASKLMSCIQIAQEFVNI